ncbi:UbiA prenyltransferase family protein, partial [Candidatus Kryptonium thompsonii]
MQLVEKLTVLIDKVLTYGKMIRFSHTVFALPFAFSSVVFSSLFYKVTLEKMFWILIAMLGARSSAMGFNRIVDRRIDVLNLRNKNRELKRGKREKRKKRGERRRRERERKRKGKEEGEEEKGERKKEEEKKGGKRGEKKKREEEGKGKERKEKERRKEGRKEGRKRDGNVREEK